MRRHRPFTAAALLLSAVASPVLGEAADLFETVAGTWAWEDKDCATEWHRISFRDDNTLAHFQNPDGVIAGSSGEDFYTYQVRGHDADSIRLFLNGEYRNDDAGNPVEWDLVLVDADTYCWHRSDWEAGRCTEKMVRRCSTP